MANAFTESVKSGASKFAEAFPVTAKLNPFLAHNWRYLLLSAIISRMAIGMARVWENRPAKHTDPSLTPNQKRQAFLERCFVELCGTMAYIATLHVGQDLVSTLFEGKDNLNLTVFRQKLEVAATRHNIVPALRDKVLQSVDEVFGKKDQGIIYRNLFGDANLANLKKAIIAKTGTTTGETVYKAFYNEFEGFAKSLGRSSTSTILGGVLISAIFGGFVTQKVNDNFVAPMSRKWLNKRFKEPEAGGITPLPGIHPSPSGPTKVFVSEAPLLPIFNPMPATPTPPQPTAWPNGNIAPPSPGNLPPPGTIPNPIQTGGAYPAPLPLRMGSRQGGLVWR